MNLSQRLDQARARRSGGDATEDGYALRMGRDHAVYDGRDLRTGEPMTEERWAERDEAAVDGLPAWRPDRANELVSFDAVIDLRPDSGAEVIDLRARRDAGDDPVFEMPAWAGDTQVFRSEVE